jgi:hypothetical protein
VNASDVLEDTLRHQYGYIIGRLSLIWRMKMTFVSLSAFGDTLTERNIDMIIGTRKILT